MLVEHVTASCIEMTWLLIHMKCQYAHIFIWLVHINLVVIGTWQLRPMNICMLQVGRWCWYAKFACYSCCIEMTLIVYVWISFLLVSAEQIRVAIRVHVSLVVVLILIICGPLQIISVFSSWTLTHMHGVLQIGVYLYNKLLV